jgi:Holliday junction resolvase RusA-like endonuclease
MAEGGAMTGTFRIFVRGVPAPKGSMRAFVVKGRPIVTSDNPKTRPWERLLRERISAEWEGPAWDGPLELTVTFSLLRPKSVSIKKRLWPDVRPDLDKLARAVKDALTGSGALRDDAQIVALVAEKRYGDEPGVTIELRKLGC